MLLPPTPCGDAAGFDLEMGVAVVAVHASDIELFADLLTSACPFDSGAQFLMEGSGKPELGATEIAGPTCPRSSEETTARADALAIWIDKNVGGERETTDDENSE
ncbi:hypothetical protein [Pseudonocardia adelaidensis]|uniref:Uncharacterized protein n=1 Tax=Pseudonocardia adelaidensis TaxID=648754 RepID=A0ABP9P5I4_9PSEU